MKSAILNKKMIVNDGFFFLNFILIRLVMCQAAFTGSDFLKALVSHETVTRCPGGGRDGSH